MALTEKQKKRIEKLDLNKGGGFYNFASNAHKSELMSDKFLFIGLGGKGTKTVAALKTAICKKVKLPVGADKPENVEFLAIDTDKNSLEAASSKGTNNLGLDMIRETSQLFSDSAARALEQGMIPENIADWKNPMLTAKLKGEGAGGIRQASRYLLFSSDGFSRVKDALEGKLLYLSNLNSGTGRLIVYVISGLSGGTGSGTFIDIPYIIREICNRNGYQDLKLEGYLFLPDAYPVDAAEEHLKYNAYAALKELDFYMSLGNQPGIYFDAQYSGGWSVHSNSSIFNVCNLITGSIQGRGRRAYPDKLSQQVVVDHIMNLIIKSELGDNDFLITSFLDNDVTTISSRVQKLDNTIPRNAHYTYNVIGIGALSLPIEQIMSYISKKAFDRMVEAWDNHPQSSEINQCLHDIGLYSDEMFSKYMSKIKGGFITYNKGMITPSKMEVINGTAYQQIKNLWMSRNTELYPSLDAAGNEVLANLISDFRNVVKTIVLDPDKGLFYCNEFLSHVAGDKNDLNGLLQRIRTDILNSITSAINGAEICQNDLETKMSNIQSSLGHFTIGVKGKIEEYIELAVNYFIAQSTIETYQRVMVRVNEFINYVEKTVDIYFQYTSTFRAIHHVFNDNYECVMNGRVETEEYHQTILDLSKGDEGTQNIKAYLDTLLNEKKFRTVVGNLAEVIFQNERALSDAEEFNPMEVYVRFIESEFKEIPNATIEELIRIKYGAQDFSRGVSEICEGLYNSSKVIFDPIATFPLDQLSTISYITAPNAAPSLNNEIMTFAQAKNARVAKSSDTNSIVWYKLICGVPLFAIGKISEYEEAYEIANLKIGLHLSETKGMDWRKLPNLNNPVYWIQPNEREKEIIDQLEQDVDKMLQWGVITDKALPGGDKTYVALIPDKSKVTSQSIAAFMNDYCCGRNESENGDYRTGPYLFTTFCDYIGKKECNVYMSTVYESKDVPGLKRMMRMNWLLYLELKSVMEVYPQLEKEVFEKNRLRLFMTLWSVGAIYEEDGFYIFKDVSNREEELLFVDDLPKIEREFGLYGELFRAFNVKVSDEMLADMEEAVNDAKHDRERLKGIRENKQELLEAVQSIMNELNRAVVQRSFKNQGKEKYCNELRELYERLINLG